MRIALLTDGISPYVLGGMQKHSFYLAKYFAREGIEVDLYHYSETTEKDISRLECFTPEERQKIHSIVLEFPRRKRLPGHYIRASYEYAREICRILKERQPVDFIYAQGFCGWKLLEEKAKGHNFPPVGVNFHGLEMFQVLPGLKARFSAALLRGPVKKNIRLADYVFSFGGKIREIVDRLGVPSEKVIQLPLGIEEDWIVEQVLPSRRPGKFLFIGRYERRKGVEELNKVLKELFPRDGWEFHFIGPIPDSKQLKVKGIEYHGLIRDPQKVRELTRRMDVLVCPSYAEGMPNVIVEAMASGLAVIASDVGAISSLVNPGNGWLIPPLNEEALRNALIAATNLPGAQLMAMKANSRDFIRDHLGWQRVIRDTLDAIRKAIQA